MNVLNDFNKYSLKSIIFRDSKFDFACCDFGKKNLIKIPKIVNIPSIKNDHDSDLYSKIPHHSQR